MSGDVQPRKRKDKKKKKDDLGIEEPRGTAAALGEGDIFMHSQHEHGTGGHWCAKVIFFSLLAVLVTLIGLIILENRGLSELEANSVESRYSGVLEGWLEDGHDGDHHDEHTLELNHHDDEEDDDDHGSEFDHDDEDEEREHDDDEEDETHDDEDENHEDDDENDEQDDVDQEENVDEDSREPNDDNDGNENSEQEDLETAEDEDEVEERNYRRYYQRSKAQANDEDDDDDDGSDDLQKVDDNDDNDQSAHSDDDDEVNERGNDDSQENDDGDDENDERGNGDSQENDDDDDGEQDQLDTNEDDDENSDENDEHNEDEEHDDHVEEDSDVEVEHIEQEVFDDDVSNEAPASDLDDKSEEASNEFNPVDEADEEEVEFLEADDLDELPEEMPIPVSKGKPLAEVEEISSERPQDTLADEEEYERQQEALRKEKEQTSQGMWLKLVVGGALLVATQAVLRRATAPRESDEDVDTTREETPLSDRRMTLISEPVPPPLVTPKPQEITRPIVQKEVVRQAPMVQSSPPPPEEIDDEVEEEEDEEDHFITEKLVAAKKEIDKELYSDEEEAEDEEEQAGVVEERKEAPTVSKPTAPIKVLPKPAPVKETPKSVEKKESPKPAEKEPTPEEDDDVEIIEDEDLGEELEEEEEDISDVDDAELLNRLEAKYGRLPEPERPGGKKDGGNSIDDEWPGEPSDAYWRNELDQAERDLRQGEWTRAVERASADKLRPSARARYIIARALDLAAEAKRDNNLLTKAIASYLELLKMNERLSDVKLIEVTDRTLNRIKFRGNYLGAEPVYRLLIRRFPDDPTHRNNLTVSFLMANRVDLAEEVIKETLTRWPNDRVALAHHGFILKTLHNRLEEAVDAFTNALEGDTGPANEPRFYYHLGDSLLLLGRFKEAHEVHKRGAKLGHFLSPAQRSLYNVDRLKSKPWWDIERTPYTRLARALEKSWKEILKEGLAAQALYEKEKEGLKERGEWSQLDLFVQGREVPNRCSRAPVTCNIVRSEVAASGCRRGQVKFSSMEAGTHVRPHVGPTNCRLRMHLGLSNTKDTFLRVDQEIRQWQTGKVLVFDDSFEHEVWHNGTGTRLVLIVDVWHPDLTPNERRQLPAI